MTRRACSSAVLLVALGQGASAGAEDYFWNAPAGGAFSAAANWLPFDALGPGADDGVHFDLGLAPPSRYTVSGVAGSNHRLVVHDDSLTLALSGDYTLPDTQAGAINFVVGSTAGDVADVVLTGAGGAVLRSHRTHIGDGLGSHGALLVTGSDWLWDAGHQVMVGWSGSGALTIENGARVVSATPNIGTFDFAVGTVAVRGAGSSWTIPSGSLNLAVSGIATMTIDDGATVASNTGNIGNSEGSSGTLAVRGSGSRWDVSLWVFLGYDGEGTLAIEDGAEVTGGDAWLGGWIGEGDGSANVLVRGGGSSWLLEDDCGSCDGILMVGVTGAGALAIEDGGRVANLGGWIGHAAGSTGAVVVRGTRARWNNGGSLFVGDEGSGSLAIEAGGRATSLDGWLARHPGAHGEVAVRGAGSSWESGPVFVGAEGTGALAIEDGGAVASDAAWLGFLPGSLGTARVGGADATWDVAGALRVGYSGDGTLAIESGGAVASASGDVGATFESSGAVTVTGPGSVWESAGTLAVGSAGTGALTVADGAAVASGDGTIGDRGTVRVEGAGSLWTLTGALAMEEEGEGAGTLGILIAGPAQHGRVEVSGGAQLAGELAVRLAGGFVPDPADAFPVLAAAGGVSGGFANVGNGERLAVEGGPGSFRVHYGAASAVDPDLVVLDAYLVPEPGALASALAATGALLALVRRPRSSRSRGGPGGRTMTLTRRSAPTSPREDERHAAGSGASSRLEWPGQPSWSARMARSRSTRAASTTLSSPC